MKTFQQLLDNQPGTVSRGEQHFSKSEIKRSLSWRILPQNFTKSEISTSFAYQNKFRLALPRTKMVRGMTFSATTSNPGNSM